uniref:Uncharacterized protein n=1 Tax=Peronospora matthiolae TaxID=2874970 RepID=A0AAV1U767_9STRA
MHISSGLLISIAAIASTSVFGQICTKEVEGCGLMGVMILNRYNDRCTDEGRGNECCTTKCKMARCGVMPGCVQDEDWNKSDRYSTACDHEDVYHGWDFLACCSWKCNNPGE